jgi:hypothetical protein
MWTYDVSDGLGCRWGWNPDGLGCWSFLAKSVVEHRELMEHRDNFVRTGGESEKFVKRDD